MTASDLSSAIDKLVRKAPSSWLTDVCIVMRLWRKELHFDQAILSLPPTHNGDLAFQIRQIIRARPDSMSWEALATSIEVCASVRSLWESEQRVELLSSGPSPSSTISARRIDQALYDLISSANREILLVTFAAYRVKLLTEVLALAVSRKVRVRLILEFEETSQKQLSLDALDAFPAELIAHAEIYYWPLGIRERNEFGRPGKLHAKVAVVDDQALLSSANLTDDAFNRNLEIGALFSGGEIPRRLRSHFEDLILAGTLVRWRIHCAP
jgi:cardiolipin synthase A/B